MVPEVALPKISICNLTTQRKPTNILLLIKSKIYAQGSGGRTLDCGTHTRI